MVEKSILLVSGMFSVGESYGAVCKELASRLVKSNWHVITTSAARNRSLRPFDMLLTVWLKRKSYNIAQIDVFSGPAFRWAEAVARLLTVLHKPYILTLHGGNLPHFAQKNTRRVVRLLTSADAVTTPSQYLYQHMLSYHDRIRVLPNPLDLQKYPFIRRNSVSPNIIWLRAFRTGYNPLLATSVLSHVKKDCPKTRLVMAGPDRGDGTFQHFCNAIDRLGLNESVECPGAIAKAEISTWLNKCDIFLNTSNIDNTPISLMEAMACGLCIVSTDVGGIPYLLEHECDALLVPPNDSKAMAEAIQRILTDPELAGRISSNARTKVEQYDWSILLPQWEELLLSTMR